VRRMKNHTVSLARLATSVFLAAAFAACAPESSSTGSFGFDDPPDSLIGSWGNTNGKGGGMGLLFDVNGSVVEVEYVPFGSTLGLEVGSGSFKLDPRGVEIAVEHSTCGSQQPSRRMFSYMIRGNQLLLQTEKGQVIELIRDNLPETKEPVAGCIRSNGTFTKS
jgi:hypothetical protein